jgi:hypothetical protein
MKSTFFLAITLLTGAVANAQTDTTIKPQTDTSVVTLADTSVGKAYVSNPGRLMSLTSETLTPADIFPALGSYKGSGNSTADVSVMLDETNKGTVWIEGLPQGRFKAIMKKAPSTYKIPAQKTENGKAIAEGTLYVAPESGELTIVVGQPFNEKEPTATLTGNLKKNAWRYNGVKAPVEQMIEAPTPPASQQQ